MGRSTDGKVNITNVTTSNIKEVLNSDSSSIQDGPIKASDLFQDSDANDIYNDFIDETYCPADEEETKKDKLTRVPFKWGQFRNYGGQEADDPETALPKIYWKNLLDESQTEHIPQTSDDYTLFNEVGLFPEISVFPTADTINNNLSSSSDSSLQLKGLYQSAMHSGSKLNSSKFASKIGIDYPDGYSGGIPKFKIKVTPSIVNTNVPTVYEKTVWNTESEEYVTETQSPKFDWFALVPGLPLLPGTITELTKWIKIVFDWWNGPFKTFVADIGGYLETFFSQINDKLLELLNGSYIDTSGVWEVLGPILAEIAIVVAIVVLADLIWDLANEQDEPEQMLFQYTNTMANIYNFTDIANSKYDYDFNNVLQLTSSKTTKDIVSGGEELGGYTLDDYNFSESVWSTSNLIDNFPADHPNRSKYLNWDFLAEGVQYDLNTPPPIVKYFVEIIPVQNCMLHQEKVTAFSIIVMPDEYKTPKFEVITDSVEDGVNTLYLNTGITFKNARYCDMIYLSDQTTYRQFLNGGFTDYHNITLNTLSNDKANDSRDIEFIGNDLSATGLDIYSTFNGFSTVEADTYYVNFMNEATTNLMANPYFRAETSTTNPNLQSYWTINSDNMYIDRGAVYKNIDDGSQGYLIQPLSGIIRNTAIFQKNYTTYKLNLITNITSGSIYLLTTNTIFRQDYFFIDKDVDSTLSLTTINGLDAIEITGSKNYVILLNTLNNLVDEKLHFIMSDDFIGNITTCKLQHVPSQNIARTKRGAYSLITKYNQPEQPIYWKGGMLLGKTMTFDYNDDSSSNYTMLISFVTDAVSNAEFVWNYIDGSTSTENYTNPTAVVIDKTKDLAVRSLDLNLTLLYDPLDLKDTQVTAFQCNDPKLISFTDEKGMLAGAIVDLSNSGINVPNYNTFNFSNLAYNLSALDVADTNFDDSVGNITSITDGISLDNTNTTGELFSIISIPVISAINTNISTYGTGQPNYPVGTEPNIVWKNSNIPVEELHTLLYALDNSATENGTLDISGDNPKITDETALEAISNLESKGWTISYNSTSIVPGTYNGVLTVGYANETGIDAYGYSSGFTPEGENIGDITPKFEANEEILVWINYSVFGFENLLVLETRSDPYTLSPPFDENANITRISIDGTDYTPVFEPPLPTSPMASWIVRDIPNPFPIVGATHVINIDYDIPQPTFPEVTIGDQTWMSVNLDIDDGLGGIYAYNDDESNVATYGRLYTWDAALRVAASIDGWHLPTDAEWTTLTTYLGGESVAGGKLKEVGTTHWTSPNTGATDEVGFTALPGGYRSEVDGNYYYGGFYGSWWSATDDGTNLPHGTRRLNYNSSVASRGTDPLDYGFSVRLIKN